LKLEKYRQKSNPHLKDTAKANFIQQQQISLVNKMTAYAHRNETFPVALVLCLSEASFTFKQTDNTVFQKHLHTLQWTRADIFCENTK
jgi:hypothetical protein